MCYHRSMSQCDYTRASNPTCGSNPESCYVARLYFQAVIKKEIHNRRYVHMYSLSAKLAFRFSVIFQLCFVSEK